MRIVAILTYLVIGVGCTHFSGPKKLRMANGDFKGPGAFSGPGQMGSGGADSKVEESDSEEEPLPPATYIPSQQGKAKGYAPRMAFHLNWPLRHIKVNQPFLPQKKRRPHLGVDFAGTKGTTIYSSHEGLVIYAGRAFKGFGKMVIVEYDQQWATLYAHLDKISVRQGQVIEQGTTLGKMGRTGRATGVHLHFELLHHRRPVDPIPLLNEIQHLVETDGQKRSPTSL